MCLIKVKKIEEEDDYEAVRRRSKRVVRRERASIIVPARPPPQQPSYPMLPPPQPVPVFTHPTPVIELPPDRSPQHDTHYVHVSPRSSSEDSRHHHQSDRHQEEVRYERREVRYEREQSPERHHEYRYVNAPEPEFLEPRRQRSRSRSRRRSTSRRRDDYYDDEIKVKTKRTYYD